MTLFRSLALQVPAIRRLRDARDGLAADLAAARQQIRSRDDALQEAGARNDAQAASIAALRAECDAMMADSAALRAERDAVLADTAPLRAARDDHRLVVTDYAYHPQARAIADGAGGRRIAATFAQAEAAISACIAGIARHAPALGRIPRHADPADPRRPYWQNDWFPPFDGAALYGILAEARPRRYIEVGSGISTRFARQAVRDLDLPTRLISIDPHPHNAVGALCDEVMVVRMEDVPEAFWNGLGAGDMLFIDNSHRSFPGSDVTVFFTEILPALPAGVTWGVHDIFLPEDYPAAWSGRFYSEQYLLMAYLLGGGGPDQVLLPVFWAGRQPRLRDLMAPLWSRDDLFGGLDTSGGALWARRRPG